MAMIAVAERPATARWALGMMSGTSLDGVDAALLRSDGVRIEAFGPSAFRPYAAAEREALRDALALAASAPTPPGPQDAAFAAARAALHDAHCEAAAQALGAAGAARPDVIGFHGQTLLHRPERRLTLQIGDAQALADALGAPVIHDFRSADVAAGGQGAPLASFLHSALAAEARAAGSAPAGPLVFLNLGGVANVTWIAPETADAAAPDPSAPGALLAFDTGPASALIDDWMAARAGAPFDADGAAAAAGQADAAAVDGWLARAAAYLGAPPPKSLDRQDFAFALEALLADPSVSVEDGAASLTALTAACVARSVAHLPAPPALWALCGGGRRNRTLVAALEARLGAPVRPVEALGFDGDMIEANAFAYLALRSEAGLPVTAPGATGAPRPLAGGRRVEPRRER